MLSVSYIFTKCRIVLANILEIQLLTKLPTEDVVCRSSRNVSDKLDLGSVSIGEEFLDTLEILQPRRTLTTCLTSLWTPTPGR
ncbi:hypothetical protein ACFW04_000456 [Cataglyphis niger]